MPTLIADGLVLAPAKIGLASRIRKLSATMAELEKLFPIFGGTEQVAKISRR